MTALSQEKPKNVGALQQELQTALEGPDAPRRIAEIFGRTLEEHPFTEHEVQIATDLEKRELLADLIAAKQAGIEFPRLASIFHALP